MDILNFKLVNKGCLLGRFDLEIKEWGSLHIHDCTVFQKNGKRWISLPGKAYESREGQKKYFSLVKFDPEVFKKLEATALKQLEPLITVAPQQEPSAQEATVNNVPF